MREQTSPQLPEQQEFHQHLRTLARSAVRVVIEEVMRDLYKQETQYNKFMSSFQCDLAE